MTWLQVKHRSFGEFIADFDHLFSFSLSDFAADPGIYHRQDLFICTINKYFVPINTAASNDPKLQMKMPELDEQGCFIELIDIFISSLEKYLVSSNSLTNNISIL